MVFSRSTLIFFLQKNASPPQINPTLTRPSLAKTEWGRLARRFPALDLPPTPALASRPSAGSWGGGGSHLLAFRFFSRASRSFSRLIFLQH